MRLLNTFTLSLREFVGDNIPSYAILSHRWEGEEVTFQDLQSGKGPEMAGYSKIRGCCAQAALDGFDYAWIDSCCIDKTSSSELSEAINSMFDWYRKAQVCYAYLRDVPAGELEKIICEKARIFGVVNGLLEGGLSKSCLRHDMLFSLIELGWILGRSLACEA